MEIIELIRKNQYSGLFQQMDMNDLFQIKDRNDYIQKMEIIDL